MELQLQPKNKSNPSDAIFPPIRPSGVEDDEPIVQFPLYVDASLPFLDRDTDIGRQVTKSIVAADFDDDCATDEDMQENAQKAMIRELTKGIDKYLSLKKTGNEGKLVKNKDVKGRFINAKAWDWSPSEA